MYLSDLTAKQIRQLTKLLKQKESLQTRHAQRMSRLNVQIERIGVGRKKGRPRIRPAPSVTPRTPRGDLKTKILTALSAASSTGITVSELSKKLKMKASNLYAWFYSTGKNVDGIRKLDGGRYVYEGK